jgi:hypothetical protein
MDQQVFEEQFIIVNYKYIPLDLQTHDPLYLDLELKTIYRNSKLLSEYTDGVYELYNNIMNYHNPRNRFAFVPYFGGLNQAHITITDVTSDIRFEGLPSHLTYLGGEEYAKNLKVGSNLIQIFLYLDINGNNEQTKLL